MEYHGQLNLHRQLIFIKLVNSLKVLMQDNLDYNIHVHE